MKKRFVEHNGRGVFILEVYMVSTGLGQFLGICHKTQIDISSILQCAGV